MSILKPKRNKLNSERLDSRTRLNWRRACALTLQALDKAGMRKSMVAVLVGSYAHDVPTWRSDVDILLLMPGHRPPKIKVPRGVHVHYENKKKFEDKFYGGDDYAVSSVRYGRLLYDKTKFWETLQERLKDTKWPSWRDKIEPAKRRIKIGDELLEEDDLDAAAEEYLLAATQISRAILLMHHIYPLSRPEIGDQLTAVGQHHLGADIKRLIQGIAGKRGLRRISRDLKMALKSQGTRTSE